MGEQRSSDRARVDLAERLEQHANWIENPTLDMASAPEMKADLREAAEALRSAPSEGRVDPADFDALDDYFFGDTEGSKRAEEAWERISAEALRHSGARPIRDPWCDDLAEPAPTVREDDEARVEAEDLKRLVDAVKWHGETGDDFLEADDWKALCRILATLEPAPTTLKGEDE